MPTTKRTIQLAVIFTALAAVTAVQGLQRQVVLLAATAKDQMLVPSALIRLPALCLDPGHEHEHIARDAFPHDGRDRDICDQHLLLDGVSTAA